MIAALLFLLDYEKIEDDDDSDASSSEDDATPQVPQAVLNKEAIYKVNCTFNYVIHRPFTEYSIYL